ncbi:uncharacterized protein LOC135340813 [Halichondria panicea]|uniref:uncharacterized protein LOC135340813 n=1 Tax=Halichondria panicea TaxID=6063 RepID=UPI00312B4A4A
MAGTVGKEALLLKDAQGEKSGSLLTAFRKKNVSVLRGSLLIALPPKDTTSGADGKPAHNYSVYNEDITLYCSECDIAPLTNYEFKLLSGISTLGARYDAFISDNHELGSNLRLGDTVYVALPTKEAIANTGCQAVVRWIGTLPGETGIKFGIEFTEDKYRGSGSTNGVFHDRQLFICDENCGMFVSLERLNFRPTRRPTAQPTKATLPHQVLSRLGLKTDSEGKSQNSPGGRANTSQVGLAANTHTQGHTNSGFRFHKGDRVVTHNKDQVPIHGTVRWTGIANTDGGKVNAVGIETVRTVVCCETHYYYVLERYSHPKR